MAVECFNLLDKKIPTKENILTIPEARECIKGKFATYHKLFDDKESELLAELELLEETNKSELNHVRSDLVRLRGVVDSLDGSLGTNTLEKIRKEQKILWKEHIVQLERSEELLSHVMLEFSEISVNTVIQIVPFRSKAKFRTDLEPVLGLKPKLGEDWFVVSKEWFSEFASSINPQQNDRWEFPVEIPIRIDDTDDVKMLHSKAWQMLLAFNGLSDWSTPFKTRAYLNTTTNKIEVPLYTTTHRCTIGHNDGDNKFSIECEIQTLPFDTYEDILGKFSGFSSLLTDYPPILYALDYRNLLSCDTPDYTQYTIRRHFSRGRTVPVQNTKSSVGIFEKQFLVIIPDSTGDNQITICKASNQTC